MTASSRADEGKILVGWKEQLGLNERQVADLDMIAQEYEARLGIGRVDALLRVDFEVRATVEARLRNRAQDVISYGHDPNR